MSEKSNRKCKHEFLINLEFLKKLISLPKGKELFFKTLKTEVKFITVLTKEDETQLLKWLTARGIISTTKK